METESDSDLITASACIIIMMAAIKMMRQNRGRRHFWVRLWVQRRERMEAFNGLLKELSGEDPRCFKNFIRINVQDFKEPLEKVIFCI